MLSAQNLTTILNTALQKLWKIPSFLGNIFMKHNFIQEDYKIYAALMQDIDQPYIWSTKHSRGFYSIQNGQKNIYVKIRKIDNNFLKTYNAPNSGRLPINRDTLSLVISEHYRSYLNLKTNDVSTLTIKPIGWIKYLGVACYVPDPFLKMSIYLGLLSFLLGIVSVFLGIKSLS